MNDKEKIELLEKQVELLEKVVELQRLLSAPPVVYPSYPSYPVYPPIVPYYGDGTRITCQS